MYACIYVCIYVFMHIRMILHNLSYFLLLEVVGDTQASASTDCSESDCSSSNGPSPLGLGSAVTMVSSFRIVLIEIRSFEINDGLSLSSTTSFSHRLPSRDEENSGTDEFKKQTEILAPISAAIVIE